MWRASSNNDFQIPVGGAKFATFLFSCGYKQWSNEYITRGRGKKTIKNPHGLLTTDIFKERIREELTVRFPSCRFEFKDHNFSQLETRIYCSYWRCYHSDCLARLVIEGTLSSDVIYFYARSPRKVSACWYFRWAGLNPHNWFRNNGGNTGSQAANSITDAGMVTDLIITKGSNCPAAEPSPTTGTAEEGDQRASHRHHVQEEKSEQLHGLLPFKNECYESSSGGGTIRQSKLEDPGLQLYATAPTLTEPPEQAIIEWEESMRDVSVYNSVDELGDEEAATWEPLKWIEQHVLAD